MNNYGVLSFRADISSFLNTEFPLPYPSIAAFYSNIDTSESGAVYYRETNEHHVLSKAEESIQNNFHEYYDFHPTSIFIVTWLEVPYAASQENRKNTSKRLLLATALKASLNSCTLTEISSGSNERHHREAYLMPRHKLDLLLKMVVYYTLEVPAVTKYEISLRKYPICPKIVTLSVLKIICDLNF